MENKTRKKKKQQKRLIPKSSDQSIPSALIITCSNTRDSTLPPPYFFPPLSPFTARHRLFSRPNFNPARNEAKLISPTASELIRKIRLPVVFRSNRSATRWIWYRKSGSETQCIAAASQRERRTIEKRLKTSYTRNGGESENSHY